MILAERAARLEAEAVAARAQAVNAGTEALITHYRLEIEKLRRQLYGTRSEKKARLLEQMELQLEELEAAATEDELAAEQAAALSCLASPQSTGFGAAGAFECPKYSFRKPPEAGRKPQNEFSLALRRSRRFGKRGPSQTRTLFLPNSH